jgi:hypothetical protein
MVLRVLPLRGSSAPVGFIYDATPDPDGGLLAAALAFFSHQAHQVFHDPCPDLAEYHRAMGMSALTVVSVGRLPDHLLSSGLELMSGPACPVSDRHQIYGHNVLGRVPPPNSLRPVFGWGPSSWFVSGGSSDFCVGGGSGKRCSTCRFSSRFICGGSSRWFICGGSSGSFIGCGSHRSRRFLPPASVLGIFLPGGFGSSLGRQEPCHRPCYLVGYFSDYR